MKKSTTQIENNKIFERELELLSQLQALRDKNVCIVDHNDIVAKLSRSEKAFNLNINAISKDENHDENFSFKIDNVVYKTKKIGNTSANTKFELSKSAKFSSNLELSSFFSKSFKNDSSFKAFYPVGLKNIRTFRDEFETITYQNNGIEYFYDCLRIKLEGINYDITQIKTELHGYYIFECKSEQTLKEFSEATFAIRQAIGFINRLLVGDEEFIFDKVGNLYYSNYIRPTLKGLYRPIITNPYSNLDVPKSTASILQGTLKRVSLESLSNLANKIHSDIEFSTAILIILESTSVRSLLLIPSSFAVIIEMLSKNLCIQELGLEKPIRDKELKRKIIKELHQVIDNNNTELSINSNLKLKRRLNAINNPINREHLTNDEKLTRPFEQLGIRLHIRDIEIIEHRNDLLHGNVLLKKDANQNIDSVNLYLNYVSAKLFTLISKLILKCIGYSGYVYNQSKHMEKHLNIETDEEYFENI